jgi:phage shock protein C
MKARKMTRYALDRSNRKLMGVCSGFARAFEVDVTLVRVCAVLSVFALGPLALIAYFAAGFIAPDA